MMPAIVLTNCLLYYMYVSVNQVISHYSCDEILYESRLKCSCKDLYKLQCIFSKVSENSYPNAFSKESAVSGYVAGTVRKLEPFIKLVAQFAITPKKGYLVAQAHMDSPSSNTVIYIYYCKIPRSILGSKVTIDPTLMLDFHELGWDLNDGTSHTSSICPSIGLSV